MVDWVKIGTSVGIGAALGVGDQLIQNFDENREAAIGEKLSTMKQAGTYFNYGLPIGALIATAFGFLKGDMATRLLTAGGVLAARKGAWYWTKRRGVAWTPFTRNRELEARRAAEARRLAEARAKGGRGVSQIETGTEITIPVVSEEEILV